LLPDPKHCGMLKW